MLQYESKFNEDLTSSVDFHFYYKLARFTQVGINNYLGQSRRLHNNNITNNQTKRLNMGIYSYSLLVQTEKDKLARACLLYTSRCV